MSRQFSDAFLRDIIQRYILLRPRGSWRLHPNFRHVAGGGYILTSATWQLAVTSVLLLTLYKES